MAESNMTQDNYVIDYRGPDSKTTDAYTSGTWKAPEGYKDLLILALLLLIPIYLVYWVYKMTVYTNAYERFPQRSPLAQTLLCCFIPFYLLAWFISTQKRLNVWAEELGLTKKSIWYFVLLYLFGGLSIIALMIQDFYNKILCVNSGATTNATGQGTCKECKATFPNDAAQCPNCGAPYKKNSLRRIIAYVIPALLLIAGFMFGVYLSFLENNYNTSDTTYVTEESYENGVSELKKGSDGQLGLYYPDGDLNSAYSGFVEKDGDWYFVENGYVNTDYVGINQNGDEIWYVENGKFEPEANGTLSFEDGDEVTVENGIVTDGEFTSATGERVRVRNGKILE